MIRLIPDSVSQIERAEEICFKFDGQPPKAHKAKQFCCAYEKRYKPFA